METKEKSLFHKLLLLNGMTFDLIKKQTILRAYCKIQLTRCSNSVAIMKCPLGGSTHLVNGQDMLECEECNFMFCN